MTSQTAETPQLEAFLADTSNVNLARSLTDANELSANNPDLKRIEHLIRNEARRRVGPAANAASDAAWVAFRARYGITDDMNEAELDAILDQVPSSQTVPGEWYWLARELRKN